MIQFTAGQKSGDAPSETSMSNKTTSSNVQTHLEEFLMNTFALGEFRRLLTFEFEGPGDALANELRPQDQDNFAAAPYMASVVVALEKRSSFNDAFWDALVCVRPGRTRQILEIRANFQSETGKPRRQKRRLVHDLLLDAFNVSEVKQFVRSDLNMANVIDEIEHRALFTKAVRALVQHHMINDDFWEVLIEKRPLRHQEIEQLKADWNSDLADESENDNDGVESGLGSDSAPTIYH